MIVGGALLASQTKIFEFSSYVRIIPSVHQATSGGSTRKTRHGFIGDRD